MYRKTYGPASIASTRRQLLGLTTVALATGLLPKALLASTPWSVGGEVVDVTTSPYNANPGLSDNTAAFQAALNYIASLSGGGTLVVPPGTYTFASSASGLTYTGGSLSIIGSGQELSILNIHHSNVALTITTSSVTNSVNVRDIGFCAPPMAEGAGALALVFPSVTGSGWPSCTVENVDFGVSSNGAFLVGLSLTNAWRSTIRSCNYHSPGAPYGTGTFLQFNGFCIDNRVTSCSVDGVNRGIVINSYMEGLHLNDCVIIANGTTGGKGIDTGDANYNSGINLLELFVNNCEFNCTGIALSLYQVNTAFISNTHLGLTTGGTGAAVAIYGSQALQFSNCQVSGAASSSVSSLGFYVGANSSNSPTYDLELNNMTFQNISTGILLAASTSATGRENRLFAPGFSALVGSPTTYGSITWQAVQDSSGNTTNEIEWVSPGGTISNDTTDRYLYTQIH